MNFIQCRLKHGNIDRMAWMASSGQHSVSPMNQPDMKIYIFLWFILIHINNIENHQSPDEGKPLISIFINTH